MRTPSNSTSNFKAMKENGLPNLSDAEKKLVYIIGLAEDPSKVSLLNSVIEKFFSSLSRDIVETIPDSLEVIQDYIPEKYHSFLAGLVLNNLLTMNERAFAAFILGVSLFCKKDGNKKCLGAEYILESIKYGIEVPPEIDELVNRVKIEHYRGVLGKDLLVNKFVASESKDQKGNFTADQDAIKTMNTVLGDVEKFRKARNESSLQTDKEKQAAADFLLKKASAGKDKWQVFCDVAALYENGHWVTTNITKTAMWIILAKQFSPGPEKKSADLREQAFVTSYGRSAFDKGTPLAEDEQDRWGKSSTPKASQPAPLLPG